MTNDQLEQAVKAAVLSAAQVVELLRENRYELYRNYQSAKKDLIHARQNKKVAAIEYNGILERYYEAKNSIELNDVRLVAHKTTLSIINEVEVNARNRIEQHSDTGIK